MSKKPSFKKEFIWLSEVKGKYNCSYYDVFKLVDNKVLKAFARVETRAAVAMQVLENNQYIAIGECFISGTFEIVPQFKLIGFTAEGFVCETLKPTIYNCIFNDIRPSRFFSLSHPFPSNIEWSFLPNAQEIISSPLENNIIFWLPPIQPKSPGVSYNQIFPLQDIHFLSNDIERIGEESQIGFGPTERANTLKAFAILARVLIENSSGGKYGTIEQPNISQIVKVMLDHITEKKLPNVGLGKTTLTEKLTEGLKELV